jgi:hypothetical protein
MNEFWELFLEPALARFRSTSIVEVGADRGLTTRRLLALSKTNDLLIHSIDPAPRFDPEGMQSETGGRLRVHRATSLEVLPTLESFPVVLLDGDHNWYTVHHELKAIELRSRELSQPFPLVFLHDVGWPYGRRDMYYAPERIPAEFRPPSAQAGLVPGESPLRSLGGINYHLHNADHEGGPRNGVLTAVEDFVKESAEPMIQFIIPGLFGLGVLFPTSLAQRDVELDRLLRSFEPSPLWRRHLEHVEAAGWQRLVETQWIPTGPASIVRRCMRPFIRLLGRT